MQFRRLFQILPILFFCLSASDSLAVQTSLLRLGSIRQWLELSYLYGGGRSKFGPTEQLHNFQESYSLLGEYAILNPRLWRGDFDLKLGLEQEQREPVSGDTSKTSDIEAEYAINGLLFMRKPVSLGFSSYSRTLRRSPASGPDYDLLADRHRLSLVLKNRRLPTSISYQRAVSETDGLLLDRTSTTDQVQIQASNTTGPSSTRALARLVEQRTDFAGRAEDTVTNRSEFSFDNRLELGQGIRSGKLLSRFRSLEETGDTAIRRRYWNESLDWRLGRALSTGIYYGLAFTETTTPLLTQETRTESAGTFLQHQLFESLTTRVNVAGQHQESSDGEQESLQTGIDLGYRKRLPARSHLTLGLGYSYWVTDRDLERGERTVIDVPLQVTDFENFLPDPDIVATTVVVRSADRAVAFVEGTDYFLRTFGRLTEIVIPPGSAIAVGQVLSLDYQFLVDPSERFDTRTWRSNGSLSLRGDRLLLWYSFSDSDERQLSGMDRLGDNDAQSLRMGAIARRDGHDLRLTYGYYQDDVNPYEFVEAMWNYRRDVFRGRWNLQVIDSYRWYDEVPSSAQRSTANNNFSISTVYSQSWNNQMFRALARYFNFHGRDTSREQAAMDLEYDILLGKTQVSVLTGVEWRWWDGYWSRSENARIRIRRYF